VRGKAVHRLPSSLGALGYRDGYVAARDEVPPRTKIIRAAPDAQAVEDSPTGYGALDHTTIVQAREFRSAWLSFDVQALRVPSNCPRLVWVARNRWIHPLTADLITLFAAVKPRLHSGRVTSTASPLLGAQLRRLHTV
jgi:hypothetical protein